MYRCGAHNSQERSKSCNDLSFNVGVHMQENNNPHMHARN